MGRNREWEGGRMKKSEMIALSLTLISTPDGQKLQPVNSFYSILFLSNICSNCKSIITQSN